MRNSGGFNMSYDFTPTHHVGMTPEGYHIGTPQKKERFFIRMHGQRMELNFKPHPPKPQNAFSEYSDGALRIECAKGNAEAIAEFEYRLSNPHR